MLGRRTYDIFAAHWPHVPGSNPIAAQFNRIPKYVASRTLTAPAWDNTTVLADVPRDVAEIKRRHAEVHLVGSADLLASLLAHDLVDELNLWLAPIVLGSGKRVFGDGTVPAAFELAAAPRPFPGGSVLLVYRRAGVPAYGDMSGGGSA